MPSRVSISTIGISVSVAKYQIMPTNEATKFDQMELPPTSVATCFSGIIPPMKPVTNTPANSSGTIINPKSHVARIHCRDRAGGELVAERQVLRRG